MPPTDSGLTVSQYSVCDAPPCGNTPPPGAMHSAVEVTQDGESAVFDLHYDRYPWFRAFDQDTVLVVDSDASTGFRRYRLLKADGSEVSLRVNADPAPAVPGPGVVAIPVSTTLDGWDRLYVVDDRAGTLTPLAVPKGIRSWGPNPDTFLWGIAGDCRVFLSTARSHQFRPFNCSDTVDSTRAPATDELPVGWLRPGRMVVEEQFGPGDQTAIHVSLDSGATWQRFVLTGNDSIASVLRSIGQ